MTHHPGPLGGSAAVGGGADHRSGDVLARAPARPRAFQEEGLAAVDRVRLDGDHGLVRARFRFRDLAEFHGVGNVPSGKHGFHVGFLVPVRYVRRCQAAKRTRRAWSVSKYSRTAAMRPSFTMKNPAHCWW